MPLSVQLFYSTVVDNAPGGAWTAITPTSGGNFNGTVGSLTQNNAVYAVPASAKSLMVLFGTNGIPSGGYTLYAGQFQFELGSTATAFSRAGGSIGGERALCEDYYQRVACTTSTYAGTGFAYSATAAFITIPTKRTMRVAPTTLDYTTPTLGDGITATNGTTITINAATPDLVVLSVTVAAGLTQFRPYILSSTNASGYIGFSAEL